MSKPAGVYPIEVYSDERVQEFLAANRMTPEEEERLEENLERTVSGETFAAADLPEPTEGERKPPERKEEGAQGGLFT